MLTPQQLGFRFPAEWEPHFATWLTFPHNTESWPNMMERVHHYFMLFVKEISTSEKVFINVNNEKMKNYVVELITKYNIDKEKIELPIIESNDCWCRDHGPSFLKNDNTKENNILLIDWDFNSWGGKYPYDKDNQIPEKISEFCGLPIIKPQIVMEGGSVEFNGSGTLITTEACLMNPNRNPHLSQKDIENYLYEFYGVNHIIWLNDGITGDDTDGHIDDITRFVNNDTVITCIEKNKNDINYAPLQENLLRLKKARTESGKQLNIIDLPMPSPHETAEGYRLPASYANFYITNSTVIVPIFRCKEDNEAIYIIESAFKNKKVVGIEANEIVHGLGTFHCMSQQVPL